MITRTLSFALLLYLVFLCSGCAYLGIGYHPSAPEIHKYDFPNISDHDRESCNSNYIGDPKIHHWEMYSEVELIKSWGEADRKVIEGETTKLFYKGRTYWPGLTITLVWIPVPLRLPINNEFCVVNIVDGKIKSTEKHKQKRPAFYGCGVYFDYAIRGKWRSGCGDPKRY